MLTGNGVFWSLLERTACFSSFHEEIKGIIEFVDNEFFIIYRYIKKYRDVVISIYIV